MTFDKEQAEDDLLKAIGCYKKLYEDSIELDDEVMAQGALNMAYKAHTKLMQLKMGG